MVSQFRIKQAINAESNFIITKLLNMTEGKEIIVITINNLRASATSQV